jgi:hypothetical protein
MSWCYFRNSSVEGQEVSTARVNTRSIGKAGNVSIFGIVYGFTEASVHISEEHFHPK